MKDIKLKTINKTKVIGWTIIVFSGAVLIKSIFGIIEYYKYTQELAKEGFLTGLVLPADLGLAFLSFLFLIVGSFFLGGKARLLGIIVLGLLLSYLFLIILQFIL